jgi:hypothetical protein
VKSRTDERMAEGDHPVFKHHEAVVLGGLERSQLEA